MTTTRKELANKLEYVLNFLDQKRSNGFEDLKNMGIILEKIKDISKRVIQKEKVNDSEFEELKNYGCPDLFTSGSTDILKPGYEHDDSNSYVQVCSGLSCAECWRNYVNETIEKTKSLLEEGDEIERRVFD